MPSELSLRLFATPTLKIPNIGLGDLSKMSEGTRKELHTLSSLAQRRKWSLASCAMRDGAFPIPSVPYLRMALQAYTFAEDRGKAKRWIIRRARALGRTDLLSESWGVRPTSRVTAAAQKHDGVMLAIYPPSELATTLAGDLPDDEPPEELHVTLAYLGTKDEFTDEQLEAVRTAIENTASVAPTLEASVQGYGTFESPEGDHPRWWSVDAVGLAKLRTAFVSGMESVGVTPRVDHDFTPHMTVRYGADQLSAIPEGGDEKWPVGSVYFVVAGERHEIKLGGTNSFGELSDEEREFAENNLEKYWKRGKGALRIRWGTPGDFTRCERLIDKHVGSNRAKRICAQWHHDVNGFWPGDKRNLSSEDGVELTEADQDSISVLDLEEGRPMTKTVTASAAAGWEEGFEYFWDPDSDATYRVNGETVEAFAGETWGPSDLAVDDVQMFPIVDDAETLEAIVGTALANDGSSASDVLPEGAGRRFRIPVVIPEGVPSGDRRSFAKDSLEFKDPPIPLLWQRETDEGHKGSVTVGKITSIERLESGGIGNAEGVFDTHEDALEAARQVKEKFLTGVSGDVDQFEAELSEDENGEALEIKHGRLVAATLVAKPAFQEATIEFVTEGDEEEVIVASAGPLLPPKLWFENPKLSEPTHLTVDDDGRVYGHIATWGTQHLGNPSIRPPKSKSGYKYFCTNTLRTKEGSDVQVGQLTLVGGHADLSLDADKVIAHYDDTRSAVADVTCGEDEHGIWVAGAVRPTVSDEQVRAFRASDPSGDWRAIDGQLELVAVCQVNTPGFPVPRTLVASGAPLALVAAGAQDLYRDNRPSLQAIVSSLVERIETLEKNDEAKRRIEAEQALEALREPMV